MYTHGWFPYVIELAVKVSAKVLSLSIVRAPPKGLHLGQNDGDTVGLREMATTQGVGRVKFLGLTSTSAFRFLRLLTSTDSGGVLSQYKHD